jgi:hypothetical protein
VKEMKVEEARRELIRKTTEERTYDMHKTCERKYIEVTGR